MQFSTYSQYYDLLYQDKDYDAEAKYVLTLLKRSRPDCTSVLELGCGTGRHAVLLAESGLNVTGVEVSETMLSRAKDRAAQLQTGGDTGKFCPIAGDARTVRTGAKYHAVISLFHVVSYQTSNEDVNRMFETVAAHLNPGGIFLFDVWYGPAVMSQLPSVRIKRMESQEISVLRIAEPTLNMNRNQVDVNYTVIVTDRTSGNVEQTTEQHHMRYYFAPELELIAQTNGFEIEQSEVWLTGDQPSPETWGVTFIARKSS